MIEIRKTERFAAWIDGLRDRAGRARILVRIERMRTGLAGDIKSLGGGLMEMRIPIGPGYRVYFIRQGNAVVILLAGGDKSSQDRDINTARQMIEHLVPPHSGETP